MADTKKKSLSYKLQKNPLLLVFIIVAAAVALFGVVNITSAIKEKADAKKETETVASTTNEATVEETEQPDTLKSLNLYSKDIVSYEVEITEQYVCVIAKYSDKETLFATHNAVDANNADYIPVFCFYTADGTRLNCPGELKLDTKNNTAVYRLTEIVDLANAVALTDEKTVTNDNALDLPFNICLQSKTSGVLGKAILGTHLENETENYTIDLINSVQGVKKAELTKNDEFIWLDIYYDDVNSYTSLNNDFITNFVCFGFESGGVSYKNKFIVTEYDSLNMVRCKFDSYSMKELADEMGNSSLTVGDLFENYSIAVWTSDYDNETSLFSINGVSSVTPDSEEETETLSE